jgi:hypothetical protein
MVGLFFTRIIWFTFQSARVNAPFPTNAPDASPVASLIEWSMPFDGRNVNRKPGVVVHAGKGK